MPVIASEPIYIPGSSRMSRMHRLFEPAHPAHRAVSCHMPIPHTTGTDLRLLITPDRF